MQKCKRCLKELPDEAFSPRSDSYKGVRYKGLRSSCKTCRAAFNLKNGYAAKWQKKYPEKHRQAVRNYDNTLTIKARHLVQRALKAGRLAKKPCAVCGNINVEAHHDDYTKPLDVVWLCKAHHEALHHQIEARAK